MEEFSKLIEENKDKIYLDNGDLTVFGALLFIYYGMALVSAICELKLKGKKSK